MGQDDISIVVKVQQLTQQAFAQVSSELKKLETQAQQTGASMGSKGLGGGLDGAGAKVGPLKAGIEQLTGSLLRYASVGAVGLALKQTLDWADGLSDLSDETRISTTNLQILERATTAAGKSMPAVTDAIADMAKRLGDGDKSAVGAVKRLGFGLEDLKRSDPYDTFKRLAFAVDAIEDPYERATLKQALFGQGAKDLDGVIKALNSDLTLLPVASEDAISTLGQIADGFAAATVAGKAFLTEVVAKIATGQGGFFGGAGGFGYGQQLVRNYFGIGSALPAVPGLPQGDGTISGGGGAIDPKRWRMHDGDRELDKILEESTAQIRKSIAANEQLAKSTDDLADAQWDAARFLHTEYARRMAELGRSITDLQQSVRFTAGGSNRLLLGSGGIPGGGAFGALGLVPTGVAGTSPGVRFGGVGADFQSLIRSQLGPTILGALQGGGNIGGSIGGLLGGGLLSGTIGKTITGGLTKALGSTVGGALGSVLPGLGTLAGGLLGGVVDKLFGYKPGAIAQQGADRDIRGMQAGLLSQYGSVATIAGMGPAGAALAAGWDSRNVQGLEHFTKLHAAFVAQLEDQKRIQGEIVGVEGEIARLREQQVPTWQQLEAAAAKYGVDVAALGPTFQQLKQNDFTQQLLSAFEDLKGQGADVGGVLVGMRDEIGQIVNESRKFKTTIPENLRPLVEELARSGNLLDDNGEKITDLADLRWGPAVETQAEIMRKALDTLNETLLKLNDTLASKLPAAAREGLQGLDDALRGYDPPGISVPVEYESPGEPVSFARGGVVRRPTRAIVGDSPHGPEIVGDVAFMTAAITGALRRMGSWAGQGGGEQRVILQVGGQQFGEAVLRYGFTAARANGLA